MKTSQDLKLLLIVFIGFRLMMLAAFTPEGIIAYGDYEHYYNLARLSSDNALPFLDYWYEFPPLFPFLSIGLYQLTAAVTGAFHSYVYALALVMLAFDAGSLALLYRIANRVWDRRVASQLGWVYIALPVGMVYTWRTFDSMTAFWLLLALDQLLAGRETRSAVALGLGVMTKYIPLLLLGAIWAFRPLRSAVRYTLIVVLVSLVIFGPFLVASPDFGVASLKAQAAKSSWQTVWALIDNNVGTGNVGPDADHFDPALATELQGRPERIPSWLTLLPFAALGLFFFWKSYAPAESPPALRIILFAGLTLTLFLLWSKGWSPQWQLLLFPLILLAFPGRNGILACLLLGLVNFLEWPMLLSRGLTQYLWLTITTRTLMLAGLAVAFARPLLAREREITTVSEVPGV